MTVLRLNASLVLVGILVAACGGSSGDGGERGPGSSERRAVFQPCPTPIPDEALRDDRGRCYIPPDEKDYDPEVLFKDEGPGRSPVRTDG